MALEGSHIRFALDLQDVLVPQRIDAYIAGSVYPDSRYMSKIDRFATHPEDYLNDPLFRSSDFCKGWLAHLLCDDLQYIVMGEKIPQVHEGTKGQGSETWVKRSSIKVLQDLDDVQHFDLAKHLASLSYFECPNGEDETVMRAYNALLQRNYAKTPAITLDNELDIWAHLGIGDELLAAIRSMTEAYTSDQTLMEHVSDIYAKTISMAREKLSTQ